MGGIQKQLHAIIKMSVMFLPIFFRNKYLKQPSIDIYFCKLTSSGDIVYKVRWYR